ncbi:hypothetical protein [Citrobacter farmeri]|uniref:hypothetical protein n=1 Tax=Citrobacter farmeri TaxID=67824 RepID=UPI00190130A7|nr:hypothetical protein [Citrobacter farmeri]MBJ9134396.1 hypothetical protein [Citrobacter farmeri]
MEILINTLKADITRIKNGTLNMTMKRYCEEIAIYYQQSNVIIAAPVAFTRWNQVIAYLERICNVLEKSEELEVILNNSIKGETTGTDLTESVNYTRTDGTKFKYYTNSGNVQCSTGGLYKFIGTIVSKLFTPSTPVKSDCDKITKSGFNQVAAVVLCEGDNILIKGKREVVQAVEKFQNLVRIHLSKNKSIEAHPSELFHVWIEPTLDTFKIRYAVGNDRIREKLVQAINVDSAHYTFINTHGHNCNVMNIEKVKL